MPRRTTRRTSAGKLEALKRDAIGASFEAMAELLRAELVLRTEPWGPSGRAHERKNRDVRIGTLIDRIRKFLELCVDPEEPTWVQRLRDVVQLYDERMHRERRPSRRAATFDI